VTKSISTLNDAYLPGVYVGSGLEVHMVANGSLWSLHYEALSYVFLLLLWTLVPVGGAAAIVAVTVSALTWIIPPFGEFIASIAYTLPYFSGGVLMHWIYQRYGTNALGAAISFVLLLVSGVMGMQLYAFALFGAYLIVFLGERPNFGSSIARKFGDCSYGIYLFGWPAEQMMRRMTHTTDPWLLFVMALPLAALLAWISFHAIEKPAMRFRTVAAARIRQVVQRMFTAMRSPRAGVLGAKTAFVVAAILLLTSKVQWWYFTESMGLLLLATAAGSLVFMAVNRVVFQRRPHPPLVT
jgi:peptidoglycan/LPS O-acetylase OafA/YrhL